MKKTLLSIALIVFVLVSRSQVLFNEVYTDPAASHNEFFELYNTSTSSTPLSMDDYTIVTYFETPGGQKGFYVMDLPNLTISPKGYFVGASDLPFDYQGVKSSTAADFSWNSAAFTSNNGYVKEWLLQPNNTYAEVALPANFNDFFYRRIGSGATYSIFLYSKGVLINSLIFGTGGATEVLPVIVAMPPLFVDMTASSPDFTIDFSTYSSINIETVMQDAGNDNGYYRVGDGLCGGWTKSDNKGQHNPKVTNGYVDGYSGVISVTAIIQRGTAATGSQITYDVISAPSSSFPVTLEVYKDAPTLSRLDASDNFFESNTETVVTDGPFTSTFTPYDANMLVVVKSSTGCIDKVMFVPNVSILPVKLIYFQGSRNNDKINLQWNVAQNESTDHFEIEKSYNGKNFSTAGTIPSTDKAGNETYTFPETATDEEKIFYRLKMIDKNQKIEYSRILSFQSKSVFAKNLAVLGNPVNDKLTISFQSQADQKIEIKVYDIAGKIRMSQPMNVYKGSNLVSLPLSSSFSTGTYIVDLANGPEHYSAKFFKQ
jgi:hypothetical protein